MTVYTDRADYIAPPCPHCGGATRPSWVDISVNFDTVGSVVVALECLASCLATREYEAFLASMNVPIVPIGADT